MVHHRDRIIVGIVTITILICIGISYGVCEAAQPSEQYANIAPLPGAGVAINSAGEADGTGAMQINIPVAYTPHWGYMNFAVSEGKHLPPNTSDSLDNGSGILGVAFGSKYPLYISVMQLNRHCDESKTVSSQLSITHGNSIMPSISVGIQDIFENVEGEDSVYAVATKSFSLSNRPVYMTLGCGNGRFLEKPFGGLSLPINDKLNFATEWDGYQINTGVGWRPNGRYGHVTLLLGYNGKAGWLAGMGTAFSIR